MIAQQFQEKDAEIARLRADLEVAVRKRPASFMMEKELSAALRERDDLRAEVGRLNTRAALSRIATLAQSAQTKDETIRALVGALLLIKKNRAQLLHEEEDAMDTALRLAGVLK